MSSTCLPVPFFLLLRRLFNAFSAFSISQNYLTSRWRASLDAQNGAPQECNKAVSPDDQTELRDGETLTSGVGLSWDLVKLLRSSLPFAS